MAEETIRVGVVGLGSFGRHHARHYAANPRATLVAVADQDTTRAAASANGAPVHADYRDLIGKVDAVSVAVPALHHYAVARDFIDAGVHVLVEKPIAVDSADGADLVRRAEARRVILQVGHIERFSPAVFELRQRVHNPRRLAFTRRATSNGRNTDVDVVLDLMIHDIDLALLLAGAPVTSVAASGRAGVSGATDEAEAWLTFANGAIATLSASRVADQGERRITITEPETMYAADLAGPMLNATARRNPGAKPAAIRLEVRDNLGAEIDAFLTSIVSGTPAVVDGRAGLAALEIAERIRASIAEGGSTKTTVSA